MKRLLLGASLLLLAACGPKDGTYTLHLLTTNDVHGSWFDSTYVGGGVRRSLFAVNHYVDSIRRADGADRVLLVDAGDCLQGDNAAYYYNYVDTLSEHLFVRLASYMKYDAVAVGNHDIETGHAVYDRVARDLSRRGVAFLAGNAVRTDDGKPYFTPYKVFRRAGLKVLVLGYTNPNMKAWLDEKVWSGMDFKSLLPLVQEDVDRVVAKEHPHVVVVAVHSGTGKGDGSILESQGLDLFKSLHGVDFLVCSHDHRPFLAKTDSLHLINSGSHARNLGHGVVTVTLSGGKVVGKQLASELIPVKRECTDSAMRAAFAADYAKVKAFTCQKVGALAVELRTRDAYCGMSPYIDLVHTVQLLSSGAQLSFAAPLTYNGKVAPGTLVYNDMFTIYPFENQLYRVRMTGGEIRRYMEHSFDLWIQDPLKTGHVFKIEPKDDPRTGQQRWSFVNRTYNFDSVAGLNYTVDVTKPCGARVQIISLPDGSPFDEAAEYSVAMTSYRASGGGGLLLNGAGLRAESVAERTEARLPEIRQLLYEFVRKNAVIGPELFSDPKLLGSWRFVPEDLAQKALNADMDLLF